MKVLLLGPPGAGKGTFSDLLEKDFKLKHISSGELLRKEIKKKSKIGKKVKNIIDKGDLVPDKLITDMMKQKLKGKNNYILDGYPRTLKQAKDAESLNINLIIYLKVPLKVIVQRMVGRRMDPVTGKIYHLKNIPPPKNIIPRVIQRDDDKPKVVRDRYKVFLKLTEPMVQYYKKRGILKQIDAARKPEEIYSDLKILMKYKCKLKKS